jgi:hypothetical protein
MLALWFKLARLKAWLETLAIGFGMPKLLLSWLEPLAWLETGLDTLAPSARRSILCFSLEDLHHLSPRVLQLESLENRFRKSRPMHTYSNPCYDAILVLIFIGANMPRVAQPASHQSHVDCTMVLVDQMSTSSLIEHNMTDHCCYQLPPAFQRDFPRLSLHDLVGFHQGFTCLS